MWCSAVSDYSSYLLKQTYVVFGEQKEVNLNAGYAVDECLIRCLINISVEIRLFLNYLPPQCR